MLFNRCDAGSPLLYFWLDILSNRDVLPNSCDLSKFGVSELLAGTLRIPEHWIYSVYYGSQGFDDMDDHIISDIIGIDLNSLEAESLRELFRKCADATVSLIRHEHIEPQSIAACQVFVAFC